MRSGLHSFSHYVPVDLVRNLVQSGGIAELGGERRDVTILFCDLADFTSYAETTAPEDAVKVLTRYFEEFGRAIDDNSGIIDKFLGDGMMALFNAPERVENPCACACRAALQGIAALRKKEIGFGVRIGLHCGECLIGNVGTSKRFTFTAIGDCVNLASRLEGLNKVYATQIIASSAFVQEADDTEFLWRRLDRVGVAGRTAPLDIYELVDFRAEASGRVVRITESYTAALDFFLRREFSQAAEILRRPELESDKPSQLLRSRIDLEISRPPDPAWEGVNRFGEK
jgi:adenylate cyclase